MWLGVDGLASLIGYWMFWRGLGWGLGLGCDCECESERCVGNMGNMQYGSWWGWECKRLELNFCCVLLWGVRAICSEVVMRLGVEYVESLRGV